MTLETEKQALKRAKAHPGQVLYMGRWRPMREVFERIQEMPCWRGARESEDADCWILTLGPAELRIWKQTPLERGTYD